MSFHFRYRLDDSLNRRDVALDLVVEFGGLLPHHFFDVRGKGVGWQAQPGVRFRTVAFDRRTGVARDLEHRGVFTERMDEQGLYAAIAGVQHRMFEQARAEAAPRAFLSTDTPNSAIAPRGDSVAVAGWAR